MLREYWSWWVEQMLDLVPPNLREAFIEPSDHILVEPLAGAIEAPSAFGLKLVQDRRESNLGRFAGDAVGFAAAQKAAAIPGRKLPIRLRVPAELLLRKELALPLAAERELKNVLAYEMDRHTPFTADEVWWHYDVTDRDRQRGKLLAQLLLIPKRFVAPLLTALGEHGLTASALDVSLPAGSTPIPLGTLNGGRARWLTRAVPLAAVGCVGLLLVAIVLPFIRESLEFSAASRRIEALAPTVAEVNALRQRLSGGNAADAIKVERARVGDPLAVLSAATRLMPDDTYLTDFTMQQRRLTLNGQAVGPAKLISGLANDPMFQDPALGTSTHAEGSDKDVFSITATARP